MTTPTNITVRVIAVDGKFIGDEVGGAKITISDFQAGKILAQGSTQGDSGTTPGAGAIMCVSARRGTPLPTNSTTSAYSTTLNLASPTQIMVTAFGPQNHPMSANTVSITTWIYPGRHMTGGNGILLEMPGLICEIKTPAPASIYTTSESVNVVTYVAMMCGCPIEDKISGQICPCDPQPWLPPNFDVYAVVPGAPESPLALTWDKTEPITPGKFIGSFSGLPAGNYQMTLYAQQTSTDGNPGTGNNTGVGVSTFIVQ